MAMNDRPEAMLRMYEMLREEILQSIRIQDNVVLGEAIVIGVLFGLQLTGITSKITGGESLLRFLSAATPIIIIISTGVWIVEQTRMMRAGEHLKELEERINDELSDGSNTACLSWESDLRTKSMSGSKWEKYHVWAHYLGPVGFFLLLGFISIFIFVSEMLVSPPTSLGDSGQIVALIYSSLVIAFYIFLFYLSYETVGHEIRSIEGELSIRKQAQEEMDR